MPEPSFTKTAPVLVPDDTALREAVSVLGRGGVIALPTDTQYGIGCAFGHPRAIERIVRMRQIDTGKRPLTLLVPDVAELARYAKVTSEAHRILNRIFPGPYCVELQAANEIRNPVAVGRRRTIGIRVPDHPGCEKLLWWLRAPLLTATAKAPDGRLLATASEIAETFGPDLDLILDGGTLEGPPSTVVSLVDDWITVLREGKGPTDRLVG